MKTAEQNYRLLQEIEANRRFLLMAYQQNPKLLDRADAQIRQIFEGQVLPEHPILQSRPQEESEVMPSSPRGKQRGVSMIELIMFIVIISIALAGILLVMNTVTGRSADALIRKQALAIAESLLEEVEAMPFTFCDPDDANAETAVGAAGCAGAPQALGAGPVPAAESRYILAAPLDNVADYANCRLNTAGGSTACDVAVINAIRDITGTNNAALGGYNATVTIAAAGVAWLGTADPENALRITVTVNGIGGTQVVLEGYRTRYAPNSI